MMPLIMVDPGRPNEIKKITGKDEVKKLLGSLGFVEGEIVTVVSQMNGNVIVNIKDTRVAIDRSMAQRILVSAC